MTNRDYPGLTYYTIRNVSLYECLGWCRDEVDCSAASFSFVVNPLAPMQETTCRLQNETAKASLPSSSIPSSSSPPSSNSISYANPQKAVNLYYFSKTHLRSGKRQKKESSISRDESQRSSNETAISDPCSNMIVVCERKSLYSRAAKQF
jgi:hypothetical protein